MLTDEVHGHRARYVGNYKYYNLNVGLGVQVPAPHLQSDHLLVTMNSCTGSMESAHSMMSMMLDWCRNGSGQCVLLGLGLVLFQRPSSLQNPCAGKGAGGSSLTCNHAPREVPLLSMLK